jgi:hypothetical protein
MTKKQKEEVNSGQHTPLVLPSNLAKFHFSSHLEFEQMDLCGLPANSGACRNVFGCGWPLLLFQIGKDFLAYFGPSHCDTSL